MDQDNRFIDGGLDNLEQPEEKQEEVKEETTEEVIEQPKEQPKVNNNQNAELEVNRKNREDYEKLMEESSTSLDDYWDKNNLFVRLLLIGLLIVIAVGSVITILSYFNLK